MITAEEARFLANSVEIEENNKVDINNVENDIVCAARKGKNRIKVNFIYYYVSSVIILVKKLREFGYEATWELIEPNLYEISINWEKKDENN